jgi:hypothetical protein
MKTAPGDLRGAEIMSVIDLCLIRRAVSESNTKMIENDIIRTFNHY